MMTPTQCQKLQERLDKAQSAYDDLMLGKSVRVLVDQNGERVEFTPATAPALASYIAQLSSLLSTECNITVPGVVTYPSGPLRFFI